MKDVTGKNVSQIRRQHNSELLRKMRNGESLTSFDSKASWFPPRPIFAKDPREIARVYNSNSASDGAEVSAQPPQSSQTQRSKLTVVADQAR